MPTLPQNLGHKPIIEDTAYKQKDAIFYKKQTDARAISLGKAIYNEDEISAKMWRYGNNKWSRQSEELPMHRVLDMAIFIIENLKSNSQGIGTSANILIPNELDKIENFYKKNQSEFDDRIKQLKNAIDKF